MGYLRSKIQKNNYYTMNIPYTTTYTNSQIRDIELVAYNNLSLLPFELMERAGKAAYNYIIQNWSETKKIIVVCGSGNNGGDGYVLSKYAFLAGIEVCIWHVGKDSTSTEAKSASDECRKLQIPIFKDANKINFDKFDLIVDAFLGIGLQGDSLLSNAKDVILTINSAGKPVLAIDCPTGINTDTGAPIELAVHADATITFIGIKQGLMTGEAKDYCGKLFCHNLNLPIEIFSSVNSECDFYDMADLKSLLPSRKQTAHKNDNGHILIIGGNFGFAGATKMSAEGALRCGAGLVSVATRKEHVNGIIATRPEIMAHGVKTKEDLLPLMQHSNIIVLGPGLGQDEWAQELFNTVIETNKTIILDADGLNLLAKNNLNAQSKLNKIKKRDNWILTPHPGEASRLLSISVDELQKDRFASIRKIQNTYGGCTILKGARSLILGQSKKITICQYGNPGMASGGMGDVLSGVVAAFVAQGIPLEQAAILGTYIHSYAADIAASKYGERGMLASDLMPVIREIIN